MSLAESFPWIAAILMVNSYGDH